MEYITQLICNTSCFADYFINVTMGMTVYPIIYRTACNKICKFNRKSTIERTSFELRCEQFKGGYMVCHSNNVLLIAFEYAFFKETQTSVMLQIETRPVKGFVVSTFDTSEIRYGQFCPECILPFYMRP